MSGDRLQEGVGKKREELVMNPNKLNYQSQE